MGYEIDIECGMVTLDGEPVGKVEDLLATLTKDEVNRDELGTCYAVAVALRRDALAHVAAEAERLRTRKGWTAEDVEREAQANLEQAKFAAAVRVRTRELIAAEGITE